MFCTGLTSGEKRRRNLKTSATYSTKSLGLDRTMTAVFLKPRTEPPQTLDPGSCDAQRIAEGLIIQGRVRAVPITAEWRAEQEAKQAAYAASRREWENRRNEPEE
jgi:hypothetical protein